MSNNSVTAETTSISAQSNSAYLVIQEKTETQTKTDTTSTTSAQAADTTAVKLYPAQVVNGTGDTYKFESAYASDPTHSTEKSNTRFTIGTAGTGAEAKDAGYAHMDTFYIGTGTYDGEFSNLKVTGVSVSAKDSAKTDLVKAVRVLIVNSNDGYWCVWKDGGEVTTVNTLANASLALTPRYTDDTNKAIATSVSKNNDVQVDIYVFYDGAEDTVRSNNLVSLADCGVTVTFEAKATEYGKTA